MKHEIHLEDGKYTVVLKQDEDFQFYAQRYNETWRDLAGDKLILAMFNAIVTMEKELSISRKEKPYARIVKNPAGDKEFHVAFWKNKGMLSGVNIRAAHMEQAIRKACTQYGIDPCYIVYAHAKDSIFPNL